ncbi:MarR family winged helix-turn-helix transcriptional regulator [Butyricicoccus faecihominis]|uniref:MarR family winged helix-turn-helix transcriptional regulator n=1 Tax=Butyricicoccus faecihominis TaxID=1712515 RepID=UPI00247937FF|nr:MarR family winged helix-turn-helix transcriptional regulator [Butyricicoccus faecihominis]MCQ5130875.1 MarR family winged helix-turn-helix transcriptional regulator [Butyricicoccus faecihominis]MCQ5130908.1 MarR family winged helix-turn-helix transcriptional regulator [Butyricicoccus faecihominis]
MRDFSELTALMERVVHKYTRWEDKKRTYGTEVPLSKAEIHTIAAVGDHPNINITALAEVMGVTKGAASQMIYKLVDKGAVEKRVSPDSDTEVVLNLTAAGKKNHEAHAAYHRQAGDKALNLLREMPEPLLESMAEYFEAFEKVIDEGLREE